MVLARAVFLLGIAAFSFSTWTGLFMLASAPLSVRADKTAKHASPQVSTMAAPLPLPRPLFRPQALVFTFASFREAYDALVADGEATRSAIRELLKRLEKRNTT